MARFGPPTGLSRQAPSFVDLRDWRPTIEIRETVRRSLRATSKQPLRSPTASTSSVLCRALATPLPSPTASPAASPFRPRSPSSLRVPKPIVAWRPSGTPAVAQAAAVAAVVSPEANRPQASVLIRSRSGRIPSAKAVSSSRPNGLASSASEISFSTRRSPSPVAKVLREVQLSLSSDNRGVLERKAPVPSASSSAHSRSPAVVPQASTALKRPPTHAPQPVEPGEEIGARPPRMQLASQLLQAAMSGNAAEVRGILLRGVSPNIADEAGWSPLHYSASSGHAEVSWLLLEFRADIEAMLPDRSTALMLAAEEAQRAVVRLLLQRGASTKSRDEDGFSALERCDPEVISELLRS